MEKLFKSIINEQLSSVEFVQDYLQLHFDGQTLTCYSWPDVKVGTVDYKFSQPGYRDAICKIIGYKVNHVDLLENERLDIFFQNDMVISLSLIRNETNGDLAEFAYFHGLNDEWFVLG